MSPIRPIRPMAFAALGCALTLAAAHSHAAPVGTAFTYQGVVGETVGQHDAASLTGGNYVLSGGFWTPGMMVDVPPTPLADPTGIDKTRFIAFSVVGGPTPPLAIRVLLVSLHHVSPPYTGGPSVPFTAFEGQERWVGPPSAYFECLSLCKVPFQASSLQCTPYYHDWTTVGLLHVTGSAIVPSSVYRVECLSAACQGVESSPACSSGGTLVSVQLQIRTTRWGDVEIPYNPPDPTSQPDLADVGALVNKFRTGTHGPIKARALLVGDDAFGVISQGAMSVDFSFKHIAACVDAFRGKPYPHTIQSCP